ncbi:hypothetical protein IQ241_24270 [Romeria aff. gracilis LEGE 07310]|uniref:Uncharacterized protein n=1 Tax=Vasconcelosia minhoensis LEGE 07310 TaxID=915328 RepID=A0A8J7AJT0_9CYAN|nr:hypothetical protein [Romeria gracilis]MBE9080366.1 hypothetical protein [Romeria aff. gracilis LEGE 07310]
MKTRFKAIAALALGFGLLIPTGKALAERLTMRYDSVPDVCDFEYGSSEGNCRLFRLYADGNYSYWNFDNFRNGTDVMFTTSSTPYDIEDGIHYYRIIYKWVDGRRYNASGTCATDTPSFRYALCRQGDYTYRYRY